MVEFDDLLQFFEKEKDRFGYSYINRGPHGPCFDVIWEFPIKDHSHGSFGQNQPKQLANSPTVGLRWDWRDVGHLFEKEGPLLTCAYVVLNYDPEFHIDEEDLFRLGEERNPWLYINRENLREIERHHTINQNVIKGLREGTSRGKQIWEAFIAGCSYLAIDPHSAGD